MGAETVRSIAQRLSAEHTTPDSLAHAVLDELGFNPERLRQALIEVLPTYVAGVKRNSRNTTFSSANENRARGKVVAMRSWHSRWLEESLHTQTGWKRVRDTTRDDWLFAAQERANHIAAESVRMNQCARMAELFNVHGATTADQLPEDAVRAVFEEAA
jgi:hypothetical protein